MSSGPKKQDDDDLVVNPPVLPRNPQMQTRTNLPVFITPQHHYWQICGKLLEILSVIVCGLGWAGPDLVPVSVFHHT